MTTGKKENALRKAYELGFSYEREYKGCAQCTFAALQDALEVRNSDTDAIFKCATGFAGGIAQQTDGSCGAYVAGAMMLGYFIGRVRDDFTDPEKIRYKTFALVSKLHRKFIEEYGTVTCGNVHMKIMGRPFYIKDPEELKKFDEAGAHTEKCTRVVALASRWTTEILADEGFLK
jgi:C_GCAxxG_C_C family probable redox protein